MSIFQVKVLHMGRKNNFLSESEENLCFYIKCSLFFRSVRPSFFKLLKREGKQGVMAK